MILRLFTSPFLIFVEVIFFFFFYLVFFISCMYFLFSLGFFELFFLTHASEGNYIFFSTSSTVMFSSQEFSFTSKSFLFAHLECSLRSRFLKCLWRLSGRWRRHCRQPWRASSSRPHRWTPLFGTTSWCRRKPLTPRMPSSPSTTPRPVSIALRLPDTLCYHDTRCVVHAPTPRRQ